MPLISTRQSTAIKRVICTHCERASDVGRRAMSVACPHCHKRLILEDFRIRGYYGVVEFATCGNIVVERSGHVVAPIKTGSLTVRGHVQGNVRARGEVRVSKTGHLKGDIQAPSIVVEAGGFYEGFLRINTAATPPDAPPAT